MNRNSVLIRALFVVSGVISVVILFHLYKGEMRQYAQEGPKEYSGDVEGPKTGRLKFIDIIPERGSHCIDQGFYLYFEGKETEDFVIVTDSIRVSFGDISGNIIGATFRFDRLMRCRSKVENRSTFLILTPPVMLGGDDE